MTSPVGSVRSKRRRVARVRQVRATADQVTLWMGTTLNLVAESFHTAILNEMCSMALHMSSAGLVLDIIGVWLLWRFGLPAEVSRRGATYLVTTQVNQDEIAKAKRYERWSWIALGTLTLGFLMQIIGNYM